MAIEPGATFDDVARIDPIEPVVTWGINPSTSVGVSGTIPRPESAPEADRPAALEQTLHPCGDPREHDADLFIGRRREWLETERVPIAFGEEDAVEEERVEMDVQIQSSAEPLDDGHGSRTTVVDPVSPRAVASRGR
jgi:homoaconitase/3-isopropylmalate dehydratase large subunit